MMEPHMIENYIFFVFVIVVNHVGFITEVLKMEFVILKLRKKEICI
jgi:Na+-translocating ferredoxin:NAD+ oxidoreductase RnfD subunit